MYKKKIYMMGFILLLNVFISQSFADSYLLSQEQDVFSSSNELPTLNAENAVDGDISTRWASAEGSDPQWIYIDLAAEAVIDRIILNWETAYGKAYEIQVSNDTSSWTTIYSTLSGDGGIDDITVTGTGRYVRMYGTERGTEWGYSLWELKIYGDFQGAEKYSLNTQIDGSGTVHPNNGEYSKNTWAELEAVADSGWKFVQWTGDLSGNMNPAAVKMDGNKNITAVFEEIVIPALSPVEMNGQLRVEGVKLVNQYGKPIQLRGMSTHGIQWYWNNYTDESLDVLAYEWGADILRISMYVQEGGWVTDPAGFSAKVSALVEKASERGMYALIDWHQLEPPDPNDNLENAKQFFTEMATEHKDRMNVIYDICNEPSDVSWDRIKEYADSLIPIIRVIDPDAIILIGTHGWASLGVSDGRSHQDILDNPLEFSNIMYGFHFYAASHQEEYLEELDTASDTLPIFVSEWGTQVYDGDQENDFEFSQRYIDLMAEKKISWTNWNYSNDHRSGAVWKDPRTGANNGPWTDDNLKPAGVWIKDKILNPPDDFVTSINGDLKDIERDSSKTFLLFQNYPNPFHLSTNIRFSLTEPADVELILYDSIGRRIQTLLNSKFQRGLFSYLFHGEKFASGIYYYKIKVNHSYEVKKMIYLK